MRKSFTRLSSLLVLLFLSFQMSMAQPVLVTAGLVPEDGATEVATNPVFTMTFADDVYPGIGDIVALYSNTGTEYKAIQLTGNVTESAAGTATFDGNVVTLSFNLTLQEGTDYYVTVGYEAIKDDSGNFFDFTPASAFGAFGNNKRWEITVGDFTPPAIDVTAAGEGLYPADNAIEVPVAVSCTVTFDEPVQWAEGYNPSTDQQLGDFAIYTDTDMLGSTEVEEGGDLLSLTPPTVTLSGNTLIIDWEEDLPSNTDVYVRVKKDLIVDMAGNPFAGINNNYDWSFTTKDSEFNDPVIAASREPLFKSSTFTVTFDEPIFYGPNDQIPNGNQSLKLKNMISVVNDKGEVIAANYVVSASATAPVITITPTAALDDSIQSVTISVLADKFYDASLNQNGLVEATFNAGDWLAPVALDGYPYASNQGGTNFDVFFKASEACKVKYIVVDADDLRAFDPTKGGVFGASIANGSYGLASDAAATAANGIFLYRDNDSIFKTSTAGDFVDPEKVSGIRIFAEGTLNIADANSEAIARVSGLPASHGEEYEVFYVMYDASVDNDPAAAAYTLGTVTYNLGALQSLSENVYTTDVLMPEAWFDGDSAKNELGEKPLLNKDSKDPVAIGAPGLYKLFQDGKIYINFNEEIRAAYNNAVITDPKPFISITQNEGPVFDPFTTFTAAMSADNKQIIITPTESWASGATVRVSIVNSKIEDEDGNEVVTTGTAATYYTQDYVVENYLAPLVRYTPATGEEGVPSNQTIEVVVSEHIYLPANSPFVPGTSFVQFTSDPEDDTYIGNFFKVRKGNETQASEGSSTELSTNFTFSVDYTYGDSTKILITPKEGHEFASETWYYFRIEELIQDKSRQTIEDGIADLGDLAAFPANNTGNPTTAGYAADNQTMVFKAEDTVPPTLVFFSKEQSDPYDVDNLTNLHGLSNVSIDDTIGVYINEWVSMGFDGYVKYDALAGGYILDGNAMRRYFEITDAEGNNLSFDVLEVGTMIGADSMVFYIDVYDMVNYPDEDQNFEELADYTICFVGNINEEDISEGTSPYKDDNDNILAHPVCAEFKTTGTVAGPTVDAVYTPAHEEVVEASVSEIVIDFNHTFILATANALPSITVSSREGNTVTAGAGVVSTSYMSVTYPLTGIVETDTIDVTVAADAFGFNNAATWPNPVGADSTWHFVVKDGTPPALTAMTPNDESTDVDFTQDFTITFDEPVKLIDGKRIYIYKSGTSTTTNREIDASLCELSEDQMTVTIPVDVLQAFFQYETHYHVTIDPGFVTDLTGNAYAGIIEEDLVAGNETPNLTSWSFLTYAMPPIAFKSFTPADTVVNLSAPLRIELNRAGTPQNVSFVINNITTGTPVIEKTVIMDGGAFTGTAGGTVWTLNANDFNPQWGSVYSITIADGAFTDNASNSTSEVTIGTVNDATDPSVPVWVINYGDLIAPEVANFWPEDAAMHVPYNAYLYVEFTEALLVSDGSALIPEGNDIADVVSEFVSLTKDGGTAVDFRIERVGNDKTIWRITPLDPDGYMYDGTQPTMETETEYTLTIDPNPTTSSNTLVDSSMNMLIAGVNGLTTTFTTEDITAPLVVINSVSTVTYPENEVTINYTANDYDGVGSRVFGVIVPSGSDVPTVSDIINRTVEGAVVYYDEDTIASGVATDWVADLGDDHVGAACFEVYMTAQDVESDVWVNPSVWSSLFMSQVASENFDRIRDIEPSPNVMDSVATNYNGSEFCVCDDDAPVLVSMYPAHLSENFAVDDTIKLKFNEGIVAGATTSPDAITLRRFDNNIAVEANVVFTPDSSIYVYVSPDSLDQETWYYLEIDRYAIQDESECSDNYFNEWVGKDSLAFQTTDNLAPRLDSVTPYGNCVAVDTSILRLYFNENNDLKVYNTSTSDSNYVFLYRTDMDEPIAWEVIPIMSSMVTTGEVNDTIKYVEIQLSHTFMNDDGIEVYIPAGLIGDENGNTYDETIRWTFRTIDDIAPVASWTLFNMNYYFNNSDPNEFGQKMKYWTEYDSGAAGEPADDAPTHVALKIEFNEDVQVNTGTASAPNWVALANYTGLETSTATDNELSAKEVFKALKVTRADGTEMKYQLSTAQTPTDLEIAEVGSNYIIIKFKDTVYEMLVDALMDNTRTELTAAAPHSDFEYFGSLLSLKEGYTVSINDGIISDWEEECETRNIIDEDTEVVTINTRDDMPPALTFSTCETNCVDGAAPITLSFDKPVVKSSYDIVWLEHESHTFDNLILGEQDIEDTGDGKYIEFFQLSAADSTRVGDPIEVSSIDIASNKKDITFTPAEPLHGDSLYIIVFNAWTVKEYLEQDPTGTLFEGDSCIFRAYDNEAPIDTLKVPEHQDVNLASTSNELIIYFDEVIMKGAGTAEIRRENGQIFERISINDAKIDTSGTHKGTLLRLPFTAHDELDDFTTYYVVMPDGYVTDTTSCGPNPFEGFGARLGEDGEMLSADWWFRTSDGTPPELLSDRDGELTGLYPEPGYEYTSRYSDLVLTFDENIRVDNDVDYAGLVIYYNTGDDPIPAPGEEGDFGNAVEFISWADTDKYTISGSDQINGFTTNVITVNPDTEFEKKGIYYVRVNGDHVYDYADALMSSSNVWSQSENDALNQVKDFEWYFTITDDKEPVLVSTTPEYDGVNAPDVYVELTSPDVDFARVVGTFTMTFEDGEGNPIPLLKGDETREIRFYEYFYNPETFTWDDKMWLELPVTDPSVTINENVVTISDVVLKDGINGDSVYYITVEPGAIMSGIEGSNTWWPGIANGFRWRFQTASDEVFIWNTPYEIISPNIITDGEEAENLTKAEAGVLQVTFDEGVGAIPGTDKYVKLIPDNDEADTLFITVVDSMCQGNMLNIVLDTMLLSDETLYTVEVEAGAFGDSATVPNPVPAFGGDTIWQFHTGDNTPPAPVATTPAAGQECAPGTFTLTMIYDETYGIVPNMGTVTVASVADTTVYAEFTQDDLTLNGDTVTVDVEGLPDLTEIFITLSEGLFIDGDPVSPLASPEFSWTFTTGENEIPIPTVVSPLVAETPDTVLVIEFSEPVNVLTLEGEVTLVGGTEDIVLTLVSTDSVTYSAPVSGLESDVEYQIMFADGSFIDTNEICDPNSVEADPGIGFQVADIAAPIAEYYPSDASDYKDLELMMIFDSEVEAQEDGKLHVYDAVEDTLVFDLDVTDLDTEDGITYTYVTNDLYYGEFYVLVDSASFIDENATILGRVYEGAGQEDWPISIVDNAFNDDDCWTIISPTDGTTNVPVETELVLEFCTERIIPGTNNLNYITVAKQDGSTQDYFRFYIDETMVSEDMSTLTIPVDGLEEFTTYSVIIAPGAIEDEAGNKFAGIIDANTWNFTTGDFTDPIATLVPGTVNNVTGEAVMSSSEDGVMYFVQSGIDTDLASINAAIAAGKATGPVSVTADNNVTVSTYGLEGGEYVAVAFDRANNFGVSFDMVTVEEIPVVTIAEIQGTGASSPLEDQVVTTTGVVTGVNSNGFFIQDDKAKYSGVWVFSPEIAEQVGLGNGVRITGTVVEYYGLTEIEDIIKLEFISSSEAARDDIEPIVLDEADDMGEDYEGVLVTIAMLKTTALPDEHGEWMTESDAGTQVKIDEQLFEFTPDENQRYNITGVVNYTYDEFKLTPRMESDIVAVNDLEALKMAIEIYPNPFENFISINASNQLDITKAVITNIAGQLVKEVITPDNTIETSELRSGVYFISLHTEDGIAKTQRIIKR